MRLRASAPPLRGATRPGGPQPALGALGRGESERMQGGRHDATLDYGEAEPSPTRWRFAARRGT